MTRTVRRAGQSKFLSLFLLTVTGSSLLALGCSSKVQLGNADDAGAGGGQTVGGSSSILATGGNGSPAGGSSAVGTGDAQSSFQMLPAGRVSGIDLLLMIDNSASMADKQATLAQAVPQLLGQLAQPRCIDAQGNYTGAIAQLGAASPCATGTPEFNPINNIHIGIVTSSLGDHGANSICSPGALTQYLDPTTNQPIVQPPDVNDKSHLVGTLERASAARADAQSTYAKLNSMGFLEWGNAQFPSPGAADLTAASQIFKDLVASTHELGCGFESQLESWFRFLIDPVPPVLPIGSPNSTNHYTSRIGSDDELLNQRAAFLRPDSMVAIIMLTDENDCSIRDTDVGWVSATTSSLITRGSDQCASNPNDRCCYSCTAGAPSGCANSCNPAGTAVDDGIYQSNIRCWNQKRRFGYEFLYPLSRYVVALTKPELCPDQSFGDMDCDCTRAKELGAGCEPGSRRMPNPLYSTTVGTLNNGQTIAGYPSGATRIDNSRVFLAGIVGVPWQDIGSVGSDGTLKYIPVTDPAWTETGSGAQPVNPPAAGGGGIWDMIYGNDNANVAPKDVHMVESIVPRTDLPGPTAAANADPINGHEFNTARTDLEYACTYTLPTPRPCACTAGDSYAACKYLHPNDCCDQSFQADGAGGPGGDYNKPLCNRTTQVAAKAYPGLREIAVLHDYATSASAASKGNSVVASICPKDLTSAATSAGYGYNPAVSALMERVQQSLKPSCLPREIPVANATGSVECTVLEAVPAAKLGGRTCSDFCAANHGAVPTSAAAADATIELRYLHRCDSSGTDSCASMCFCELPQEKDANLTACQTVTDGSDVSLPPGFCYISASQNVGNPQLVSQCPGDQQRMLRFVGNNPTGGGTEVPLAGSYVLMSCNGTN